MPIITISTQYYAGGDRLYIKKKGGGIPWWSSSQDPVLSLLVPGSTPGWGTKIPQAAWHGQKKRKSKKRKLFFFLKNWKVKNKTNYMQVICLLIQKPPPKKTTSNLFELIIQEIYQLYDQYSKANSIATYQQLT